MHTLTHTHTHTHTHWYTRTRSPIFSARLSLSLCFSQSLFLSLYRTHTLTHGHRHTHTHTHRHTHTQVHSRTRMSVRTRTTLCPFYPNRVVLHQLDSFQLMYEDRKAGGSLRLYHGSEVWVHIGYDWTHIAIQVRGTRPIQGRGRIQGFEVTGTQTFGSQLWLWGTSREHAILFFLVGLVGAKTQARSRGEKQNFPLEKISLLRT